MRKYTASQPKKCGNGDVGHVYMHDVSHPDTQAMPK